MNLSNSEIMKWSLNVLLSYVVQFRNTAQRKGHCNNENYVVIKLPLIKHCPNFVTNLDFEKALVV